MTLSRRDFLSRTAILSAASAFPSSILEAAVPSPIQFGYASICWNGHDQQAIEDISAVGFPGIQLRSNILPEYGSKPEALRSLLDAHHLTFVALSSGGIDIDGDPTAEVSKHTDHAKFVHDAKGLYMQILDAKAKSRAIVRADYDKLGGLLTALGKSTAALGVPLGYHNHMGTLSENPEGLDWILAASDPKYVHLELDIAHYFQGGGDPVKAIEKYSDRLLFMHLKDVEKLTPTGTPPGHSYRFVELGRGQVNVKAAMDALKRVSFKGWAIVELDAVPDNARTPKESAALNKIYLEQTLEYKV
jgi:inosose dehydratase